VSSRSFAVLEDGLLHDEGKIGVTLEALRAWADGLRPDDQIALEATGNSGAIAQPTDANRAQGRGIESV
jgi:hypothetical protein